MASIKVSELPAVNGFTTNDVLIINDEDTTTSSITMALFLGSLSGQPMIWTNTQQFNAATTFGPASVPVFQSNTTFNETVTFNGPVVLGAASAVPLNALSDVTINSTPTDGFVLTYDTTTSQWVPEAVGHLDTIVEDTSPQLGGNLDVNDFYIVNASGNVVIDPPADGKFVIQGEATRGSGSISFNCEENTHAVEVKGPAHSAAADYTLLLPIGMGAINQVLSTDGTTQTSWVNALQWNVNNNIPSAVDDAAATVAGVPVGGIYQNAGALRVRLA